MRTSTAGSRATKPISRSYCTTETCPTRGKQPSQDLRKVAPLSSPSTTGTTSTSSSTVRAEVETRQGLGNESHGSYLRTARALQSQLSQCRELSICGNSFSIVSVTVSKEHMSMVLQDTPI